MVEAVRSDMVPVIVGDDARSAGQIEQVRANVMRQGQERKAAIKSPADARDYYSGGEDYSRAKNTYLSIREELRGMRQTFSREQSAERDNEYSGPDPNPGTAAKIRPDTGQSYQVYNSLGYRQNMSFSALAYIGTTVNTRI